MQLHYLVEILTWDRAVPLCDRIENLFPKSAIAFNFVTNGLINCLKRRQAKGLSPLLQNFQQNHVQSKFATP